MLQIYFENNVYTSKYNGKITVKSVIDYFKKSYNLNNMELIPMDERLNILNPEIQLNITNTNTITIFLIIKPNINIQETTQTPIEELIMKATNATQPLKLDKSSITSYRNNPFNFSSIFNDSFPDNNVSQILRVLERINDASLRLREPLETVADENYVQQLVEMGFDAERARDALVRAGNDMERATEYLLQ